MTAGIVGRGATGSDNLSAGEAAEVSSAARTALDGVTSEALIPTKEMEV